MNSPSSIHRAKCPSCRADITGLYCSACGEKQLSSQDFSVSRIFGDAVSAAVNLDSKLWLSLRTILFKPGVITKDYFSGRRNPYLGPFKLFLIASILFFIGIGSFDVFMVPSQWFFGGGENSWGVDIPSLVTQKAESKGLSEAEIALLYDSKISGISKLFLIVAIPFLALTTFCLRRRKAPELGKHFIFATHNFTFVIFWLLLAVGISIRLPEGTSKPLIFSITGFVILAYLTLAIRKVWDDSVWKAALTSLVVFVILIAFMISYRTWISYLTLKLL